MLSSPPQGVQLIFKKLQYVSKTDGRTLPVKSNKKFLIFVQTVNETAIIDPAKKMEIP